MPEYRVSLTIEIEADTAQEAADKWLSWLRDTGQTPVWGWSADVTNMDLPKDHQHKEVMKVDLK